MKQRISIYPRLKSSAEADNRAFETKIPASLPAPKSAAPGEGGGRIVQSKSSAVKRLARRTSQKDSLGSQVYEWTKKMTTLPSCAPTAFSTTSHNTAKPPRNRSNTAFKQLQHDDVYNPQKISQNRSSHDEMDVHTLGTASTMAATSSYSMADDASYASEIGMEVVMSGTERPCELHSFKAGKETFTIDKRYTLIRTVGSGAYGVVISAEDSVKKRQVAIKMVARAFNDEIDAKRILREIKLLKHFNHENIVGINDMMPPQAKCVDDFNDVYIVGELMETDLHRIIYSKQTLSIDHVQYFVYQVLRGLKCVHSANVIHRDLKPSNLLVNSNCDLKICDFGLARGVHVGTQQASTMLLTEYVVTRWYRAPEIMLACHEYSKPVDVWSVGCIFAELILRKPFFPGEDYIDQVRLCTRFLTSRSTPCTHNLFQLTIITEKLGKVGDSDLDFVTSEKAKRFLRKLPDTPPASFPRQFPGTPRAALDLLNKMLQIHPRKRISVEDALSHPFFAQLHSPQDEPVSKKTFDFSFEKEKLTRLRLKELIWGEVGQFRPSCLPVPPRRDSPLDLHEM